MQDTALAPQPLLQAQAICFVVLLITFGALEQRWPRRRFDAEQLAGSRWRHAGRNLLLGLLNLGVGLLAAPLLYFAVRLGSNSGLLPRLGARLPTLALWAIALLSLDLWMYLWHRALHRMPLLWRFHRVHHSDRAMGSTTSVRFHFGEIALSHLARTPVLLLLGVSLSQWLVYETLMLVVSFFHHSNLSVGRWDATVRRCLVTPSYHQVHHSTRQVQTDSNYGVLFPWWDCLLGSYTDPATAGQVELGLIEFRGTEALSVLGTLRTPLRPVRK